MLCPYCNNVRADNFGPCPFCGAASPLGWGAMDGQHMFNQPMPQQPAFPTAQGFPGPQAGVRNYAPPSPPVAPGSQERRPASLLKRFPPADSAQQAPFQQGGNDNSLWGQVMAPQAFQSPVQAPPSNAAFQSPPSLLPVPYSTGAPNQLQPGAWPQSQQGPNNFAPTVLPQGFPTAALAPTSSDASLVPAKPQSEEGPIYVAPMYTKPRPIIPRYRAISGLLSVLIVSLLLCTGAGLYAKATGKLSFLRPLFGGEVRPKSISPTPIPSLPVPKVIVQLGPASNVITSASTASNIDFHTAVPLIVSTTFKPNSTIYLTYSVHPSAPGAVLIKWYTNGNYYVSSPLMPIKNAKGTNGYTVMQFAQPLEGSVELYWNNQLGIRLYFVVTN